MTSLGKWVILARARTALGARKSFSVLAVTTVAAAGLTAVAAAGPAGAAATHAGRHHHAASVAPGSGPSGDETTVSQNDLRDGWDPNEPALTPAALQNGSFGQIFKTPVNGQVYGQPLVVGNTLIVATETDWVYGLDATTGAVLWKTSLGTPYHITNCTDLTPDIGVTSTGVYDPSTGTVYEMALVHEINWEWHLFGLNVSTGAITFKQRIVGHPTNDSHLSFSALPEGQRAGLLLMNGWVYATFASHCDNGSYNGYVGGVNTATNATTLWADESGVSNEKGGIWQSGGGVMSDGSGRIFVTSGNGISPPKGPGNNPPGQLAESVIRLSPNTTTGALTAAGLLQPVQRPLARLQRLRLRIRRPDRGSVRHQHLPGHHDAGGQGPGALPAEPGQPGRPDELRQRRARQDQPHRQAVEPSGVLRRHPDADHRQRAQGPTTT